MRTRTLLLIIICTITSSIFFTGILLAGATEYEAALISDHMATQSGGTEPIDIVPATDGAHIVWAEPLTDSIPGAVGLFYRHAPTDTTQLIDTIHVPITTYLHSLRVLDDGQNGACIVWADSSDGETSRLKFLHTASSSTIRATTPISGEIKNAQLLNCHPQLNKHTIIFWANAFDAFTLDNLYAWDIGNDTLHYLSAAAIDPITENKVVFDEQDGKIAVVWQQDGNIMAYDSTTQATQLVASSSKTPYVAVDKNSLTHIAWWEPGIGPGFSKYWNSDQPNDVQTVFYGETGTTKMVKDNDGYVHEYRTIDSFATNYDTIHLDHTRLLSTTITGFSNSDIELTPDGSFLLFDNLTGMMEVWDSATQSQATIPNYNGFDGVPLITHGSTPHAVYNQTSGGALLLTWNFSDTSATVITNVTGAPAILIDAIADSSDTLHVLYGVPSFPGSSSKIGPLYYWDSVTQTSQPISALEARDIDGETKFEKRILLDENNQPTVFFPATTGTWPATDSVRVWSLDDGEKELAGLGSLNFGRMVQDSQNNITMAWSTNINENQGYDVYAASKTMSPPTAVTIHASSATQQQPQALAAAFTLLLIGVSIMALRTKHSSQTSS